MAGNLRGFRNSGAHLLCDIDKWRYNEYDSLVAENELEMSQEIFEYLTCINGQCN